MAAMSIVWSLPPLPSLHPPLSSISSHLLRTPLLLLPLAHNISYVSFLSLSLCVHTHMSSDDIFVFFFLSLSTHTCHQMTYAGQKKKKGSLDIQLGDTVLLIPGRVTCLLAPATHACIHQPVHRGRQSARGASPRPDLGEIPPTRRGDEAAQPYSR